MDRIDVHTIVAVPLKAGGGQRVVAADGDAGFHLIKVTPEHHEEEQSFTAVGAHGLAEKVLAGDELAMTGRGTLRILAAALLVSGGDV